MKLDKNKYRVSLIACFFAVVGLGSLKAQEGVLPVDFRQHNLTQFNASIVNPTFSLDWDQPRSVTIWSRYQWQNIDFDPTTVFVNYSQRIGNNASGGIGAFRHNTGVFLQQGGYINGAYAIPLGGENNNLSFGFNAFLFDKSLPTEIAAAFDPAIVPGLEASEGLVFSLQTGMRLQLNRFNAAFGVENTYDYNFSLDQRETGNPQRVFQGLLSYDIPISIGGNEGTIRPIVYGEGSGVDEFRYGGTILLTTPKFWVQAGYNDFYGAAGGMGVTLFDRWSVGALIEVGIEDPTSGVEPTYEIITSYNLGRQTSKAKRKKKQDEQDALDRAVEAERQKALEEERRRRAIAQQDSIYQARLAEKRRMDSIARAEEEQRRLQLAEQERKALENERIEEVSNVDGMQKGYYLIANVFATEKYFQRFMTRLRREGLEPKYFFRGLNGYNYVYLDRYDTLSDARQARDSQYFGRYFGETWIFRVK